MKAMTQKHRIRHGVLRICLVVAIALFFFACGGGGDDPPPVSDDTTPPVDDGNNNGNDGEDDNPDAGLAGTFKSREELEAYLKDQYAESVQDEAMYFAETDAPAGPPAEGDFSGNEPAGGRYSETNVQEQGVDESDVVKTNGEYLFVAGGDKAVIISTGRSPAPAAEVAVDGVVDSLYLYGDLMAVLYTPGDGAGYDWGVGLPEPAIRSGMPYWIPVQAKTGVMLVDVSDPVNPAVIQDVQTEGHLVSSRVIDGRLHVIQQFLPDLPPIDIWYDGTEAGREQMINENRRLLADLTLEDLAPEYVTSVPMRQSRKTGLTVAPEHFFRPETESGGTMVTVVSFDLDNPETEFDSVGVVADAHIVYASTTALYLCSTLWEVFPLMDAGDGTEADTETGETVIRKLALTGDAIRQAGSGSVPGRLLNQFSLGEYEDVLRVATTTGFAWWGDSNESKNHVYCLREQADTLEIIGRIENLAPGEELYAARFLGPKGYLVTFQQVDPLFTLDLATPESPELVGELKVPGYSDYIHPLGENHLLTIGKDVKLEADPHTGEPFPWYQGIQLSIFDVGDFSNPALVHKEILGVRGTESEALHNHKAFTFWPAENLLAFPVNLSEYIQGPPGEPWQSGEPTFSGLYVYQVSAQSGFEFLGRLSLSDAESRYWNWMRGVFIEDDVYAIRRGYLKAAPVDNISGLTWSLTFGESDDPTGPPPPEEPKPEDDG
jgi:hypothetical protein